MNIKSSIKQSFIRLKSLFKEMSLTSFVMKIMKLLSYILFVYPISVLLYGLGNYFLKLNWKFMPCGYNEISFMVFMTCLFLFTLYMMLREKDDCIKRAIFGIVLLFSIFHPTVFDILTKVITVMFSLLLINLIWKIWKTKINI